MVKAPRRAPKRKDEIIPTHGDVVRWKRPGIEKSWAYGRLSTVERGAAVISEANGGGIYTIAVQHVQIKVVGPRGGVTWHELLSES